MSKLLSDEELLWHIRKTENPHYACEFKQDNTERKTVKCGGCLHSSESVRNAENALLDLINTQKRLYAESVLDEVLVAIDKNIEASKGNLKYARDHNNSDRTIANWKGCIEGEKFIKDDVMRLRAEQRARIK